MRQIILWTASQVFHVVTPLVYRGSGSGDKTFDWVGVFCLLCFAILATTVWSVLDRHRENYIALHKWFRLFIRLALASVMFTYGMIKVIPLQMPFPSLTRLVEPFGKFTPLGVLWNSIGSAPQYEFFAGFAETLGGLLLLVPPTAMFGAVICLAEMVQVFVLNMSYDVPVKITAFHLIFMAAFLLAPDLSRLANFFFLNRPTGASTQPSLFRTQRANRIAVVAQIVFGVYLISVNAYGDWRIYSEGQKSPFYGIWNVAQLSIDGQPRASLFTDNDVWRRVIFDFAASATFQHADDSFTGDGSSINLGAKTIVLTKGADKDWKASFTFERPAPDQLSLDGEMDKHKIHMELQLIDRNQFPLVSRGFHWIAEYPFDRAEVQR